MAVAKGIAADMRKLDSPHIPVQIALLVALACIPDRFSYLARLNTPEVLRDAAKYLDDQLLTFYCKLSGIQQRELTPAMRAQLWAPRRFGGRGLRSCEALLERAYLGSLALSARHLQPLLAAEPPGSGRLQATELALEAVRPTVAEELADELLPANPENFVPYFSAVDEEEPAARLKEARELQDRLNTGQQLLQDQRREEMAKAGTVRDRALRNVNRAPGASHVFTTMPTHPELQQTAAQVSIGERLHLGLPPFPDMPLHCHCNKANGQYGFDPWHGMSCGVGKAEATHRHDDLKYGVARWATRMGGRVKVEPRAAGGGELKEGPARRGRARRGRRPSAAPAAAAPRAAAERKEHAEERIEEGKAEAAAGRPRRKRFDLLIYGLGQPVAVDFVVQHSLAPSHVERSAVDAEKALAKAEAEKQQEYEALAEKMGAKFFAFAVDTAGRLGTQALAFIRLLIQEGARFKNVWAPKEVVEGIYRTVAIAVARGNADMVQTNLFRSRAAAEL